MMTEIGRKKGPAQVTPHEKPARTIDLAGALRAVRERPADKVELLRASFELNVTDSLFIDPLDHPVFLRREQPSAPFLRYRNSLCLRL
jgi:hypothetical protein